MGPYGASWNPVAPRSLVWPSTEAGHVRMILDDSASIMARRIGRDVELRLPRAYALWKITPPEGHHVVAVDVRRCSGHVTSDGETLWIWRRRMRDRKVEHARVDLIAAAREVVSPPHADRIAERVRDCARLPQGELQLAVFLSTQEDGEGSPAKEPRWPTVIFGCTSQRLVAAQLDYFARFEQMGHPPYRDVLVSPMTVDDEEGPRGEAELLTFSVGADTAAEISRNPDGKLVLGEPLAIDIAFDAAWPMLVPLDVPEPTHGISLIRRVGDNDPFDLAFGVASEAEIVLGGARVRSTRVGAPEDMVRMPRRDGDRLVGVTARLEAIVQRANRLELRRPDHVTLLVETSAPFAEISCNRGGVVYRVEGETELRSIYL